MPSAKLSCKGIASRLSEKRGFPDCDPRIGTGIIEGQGTFDFEDHPQGMTS